MRPHDVIYLDGSTGDLQNIYIFIRDRTGSASVAGGYLMRLQATCDRIGENPHAGRPRDDLQPGLRTWSFERRAVIAYHVVGSRVLISHVFYAGRDLVSLFVKERLRESRP